jgi:diadenylate cyclase
MASAAERHAATLDASARMRATLSSVAPGTALREGLERILRGRTGALIVIGHDKSVEAISTGGFRLDVPFTATGLRELAKMDGAIVLDRPPAASSWPGFT